MADVDESLIEQVYVRVLELHREAHLGHAIALGRSVVEKLLGGDVP